ncbi:MAG: signal peptidase I [Elusimicrobiota bacterium]
MDFSQMNMERKVIFIAVILITAKIILVLIKKYFNSDNGQKFTDWLLEWVNTGMSALIFAFLIMYFLLQAFKIPSGSMQNTLLIKDHLFVNKVVYGWRLPFVHITPADKGVGLPIGANKELSVYLKRIAALTNPKRGDIVVFAFPEDTTKDFIKRCVGLPGDTIEVRNKVLYVNGEAQNEPYVIHSDFNTYPNDQFLPEQFRIRDNFGPIIVPEKHYFVMGDNRDASYDSRFWGPLHTDYIKGKALVVYWPPSRIKAIK